MPPFNGLICASLVHLLEHKSGNNFIHQWERLRSIMAADPCGCIACLDAETKEGQNYTPLNARERQIYHNAYWAGAQAGRQDIKAQANRILGPAPRK